ncbi:hypothetical protein EYF80_005441 [Liparis tanakae]|uniref:Uncharacterized protein n=1 Tax=Liparis tanakae TaxID=230148 RepID=A0A4Z2J431_9TELE|nr:hypothetical protein EYF80_005441 [Liparis tanakae]
MCEAKTAERPPLPKPCFYSNVHLQTTPPSPPTHSCSGLHAETTNTPQKTVPSRGPRRANRNLL